MESNCGKRSTQLSGVGRILADGSGNVVEIIKSLQIFVSALRDSNAEIVQFQDRLASVTSVIDGSRNDLDAALTNLGTAVVDVKRFVAGTRNQTAEQLQRLNDVTQNLVDNRTALENVLHVAPNAIANGYNIYSPDSGTGVGAFALSNFSDPVSVVCSAIAAVKNATASETSKLCAQYLGPALRLINFNYLPMPFNAYLRKSPSPDNLVYSDPNLAPGGPGGSPDQPVTAPAVSAYTGTGDVPPPAGWGAPAGPPGAYAPNGLPADPSPALFRGAPIPPGVADIPPAGPPAQVPANLQGMLLPAELPAGSNAMIRRRPLGSLVAIVSCVVLAATGCTFNGLNSLPLPGTVGRGGDAKTYHVELTNIGTLEANSPVLVSDVVVGSVSKLTVRNWHADVEISVQPDVVVPANAVASVGQTSLLGSMHLALNPPLGQSPTGRLAAERHHRTGPVDDLSLHRTDSVLPIGDRQRRWTGQGRRHRHRVQRGAQRSSGPSARSVDTPQRLRRNARQPT